MTSFPSTIFHRGLSHNLHIVNRQSRKTSIRLIVFGVFALCGLALVTALATSAYGQIVRKVSYQGILEEKGAPVTGVHSITVNYYNASGATVYGETFDTVLVQNGIFNVQLGSGNSGGFPQLMNFNEEYFLGIAIDGGSELIPRTEMLAAPYAINAGTVGGIAASTVPVAGQLFPLDGTGHIDPRVLPTTTIGIGSINQVGGDSIADIHLNPGPNISIINNAAAHSVTISGLSGIDTVIAGPGLTGGGTGRSVTLAVAPNSIDARDIASGSVGGRQLDPLTAGLGLYQDALGNLNIGVDNATIQITGDNLNIKAGGINTLQLADQAVTNAKIADGAVNAIKVDPNQIQLRVNGLAAPGSFIQRINVDGSVNTATIQVDPTLTRTVTLPDATLGIALSHPNTWTGQQNFNGGATATTLTVFGQMSTNGITNSGLLSNNGPAQINGSLGVSGISTLSGITNTGLLTNNGNAQTNGTLGVTGQSNFGALATFAGITNNGALSQNGDITQTSGSATFLTTSTGPLTVNGSGNSFVVNNTNPTNSQTFAAVISTGGEAGLKIRCSSQSSTSLSSDTHFLDFFDGANKERGSIQGQDLDEWNNDPLNIMNDAVFGAATAVAIADGIAAGVDLGESLSGVLSFQAADAAAWGVGAVQFAIQAAQFAQWVTTSQSSLGVAYTTSAGDYAEYLRRADPDEHLAAGDVVGMSNGIISKKTSGAQSILTISLAPGVLGNVPPRESAQYYNKVAFLGQVPVKVRGAVHEGDFVIASGLDDGVAVAVSADAITPGQFASVIGRAWTASMSEDVKLIKVAVGLNAKAMGDVLEHQQAEIDVLKAQVGELAKTNAEVSTLKAKLEQLLSQGSSTTTRMVLQSEE